MNISKKADIFDFLLKYSPRSNSCQITKIMSDQKKLKKDIIRISRFLTEFRYELKKAHFLFSNPHSFNTSQNIYSNFKNGKHLLAQSTSIDSKLTELAKGNHLKLDSQAKRSKQSPKNINYSHSEYFDSPLKHNLKQLFAPEEISPFIGLSFILQNLSTIFKFLHEHPIQFYHIVIQNLNDRQFLHFTQSILPSLFGYFSSEEFLELGATFYEQILSQNEISPDMVIIFLDPFLNSVASSRFIEKIVYDFFNQAELNFSHQHLKRKKENETDIDHRDKNSHILLNCINNSISLLPKQFFRIFRKIKEQRWTLKNWCNLFFDQFIFESMNYWIKASFSHDFHQLFIDLKKYQFMDKTELTQFFINLVDIKSAYEIPELYRCFDVSSLDLFLGINDVKQLLQVLVDNKFLPNNIDISAFDKIPQKVSNSFLWCSFYSSNKIDIKHKHDRIIFDSYDELNKELQIEEGRFSTSFKNQLHSLIDQNGNDITFLLHHSGNGEFHQFVENYCLQQLINDADDFENVIEVKRLNEILREWEDTLLTNKAVLILSELEKIPDYSQIIQTFPNEVKQAIFLRKIDTNQFKPIHDTIANLGSEWDFLVHSSQFVKAFQNAFSVGKSFVNINSDQESDYSKSSNPFLHVLEPSSLFKSQNDDVSNLFSFEINQIPRGFFAILNFFTLVNHVQLPEQFQIVMKAMNRLDLLFPDAARNQMIFILFLQNIPGNILLPLYVELNVFCMREPEVFNYCSELDRKRWTKIEGLILKFSSQNLTLCTKLLNEQVNLQNSFDNWKKKYLP